MKPSSDPFVQKILWDRLVTIADETVNSLVRTSFSMNVRDSYDLSCVIFDEKGRSVAQGTFSLPTFTGTAPQTLQAILERFPVGTFEDGDVFITNDPWLGTGHLYDVNVCRPIFNKGRLLGYAMSITHLPDIGGAGMSSITREVYEEGLIIPPQKLVIGGRINEGLLELIRANVRVSDQVLGDLDANLSCTQVGARSVKEFCEEYGIETLSEVADAIISRTSAALEQGLLTIPDGKFVNELRIEDVEDDVTLKVTIEKKGKSIKLDFSGSSPQRTSALNVPFCYTRAVSYYTLKCIFASDLPNNEGTFSPIEVFAPAGCILNAQRPAATGARHTIGHYVFPLIMGALKDLVPDRVITEMGMMNVFNVYGRHKDGTSVASLFFLAGGFGALNGHDGRAAIPGPSNMSSLSTEVWEDQTSITVSYRSILPNSGGPGEFPGGPGQEIEFLNTTTNDMTISFLGLRTRIPAKGMAGGGDGALRRFYIDDKLVDGKGRHTISPQSRLRIQEAGAGGMGDRRKRTLEAVEKDIAKGYIDRDFALRTYPALASAAENKKTA